MKIFSTIESAIRNEIDIDKSAGFRLGLLEPGEVFSLPRIIKLRSLNRLVSKASRYRIVDCLFCLLFAAAIILAWAFMAVADFSRSLIRFSFKDDKKDFFSSGDFAFQSHGKIDQCMSSIGCRPEVSVKKLSIGLNVLIKPTEYIISFLLSVAWLISCKNLRLVCAIGKDETFLFRLTQSYVVYKFIAALVLLDRFREAKSKDSTLYICNHYDRWAVAVDCSGIKYCLIQHGKVVPINLTYKLRRPIGLFVYDDQSRNVFFESVLNVQGNNKLIIKFFSVKLNLIRLDVPEEKVLILYVGEAYNSNFEYEFLTLLLKYIPECFLIYKKHPRFGVSGLIRSIKHKSFMLFDEADKYPIVNYVISLNSTLGDEYEREGFSVYKLLSGVSAGESFNMFEEFFKNTIVTNAKPIRSCDDDLHRPRSRS